MFFFSVVIADHRFRIPACPLCSADQFSIRMNKEIIIISSIIINIIIIIIIIVLLHGVTSIKISFYDFLFSNKNEEVYNLCR